MYRATLARLSSRSGLGTSRTTSVAFLSVRKPRNTGWRISAPAVHSVNFTSATSLGLTQGGPTEVRDLLGDRLLIGDQRNELLVNRAQHLSVEACSGAPRIFPTLP